MVKKALMTYSYNASFSQLASYVKEEDVDDNDINNVDGINHTETNDSFTVTSDTNDKRIGESKTIVANVPFVATSKTYKRDFHLSTNYR